MPHTRTLLTDCGSDVIEFYSSEISCLTTSRFTATFQLSSSLFHAMLYLALSSHVARLLPSLQVSDEHAFIVHASQVLTSSDYSANYRGIVQSLDTRSLREAGPY